MEENVEPGWRGHGHMELGDISTIAVLGAGNMGHGIAEVAALAGYDVTLRDINQELVDEGYDQIEWSLNKLAEKDRITDEAAQAAADRLEPVVEIQQAVSEAEVIIEAVPEVLDIKTEVFSEVAVHAPDHAIFATNTSSLSITELAESTDRPGQFCGMHFFNPPVRMDLVEVISGAHTTDETLALIEALAAEMDKTPIRVHKDSPGFIVNRVLIPLLNEAAWLVEDGNATIAAVDATTKFDMGLPMGAFELADQVGIDVSYHVLEYMHETLGPAYRPCPLFERKLEAETVGKKAGEGFYDYNDGGAEISPDAGRDEIADHLLAVMANEVAGLIENEVADATAIDRALQLGAGFPDGPAKMTDSRSPAHLVSVLDTRHEETDEPRYEAVALLRELAAEDTGFHSETAEATDDRWEETLETIHLERENQVARIVLDRQAQLNSITAELLDELSVAIEKLDAERDTRCLVISGAGSRAFSVGADVKAMATGTDPLEAVELSRLGQQTFGALETCDTPVVAAIDGYCLGGGMELATVADLRIATDRSRFGQPEHTLGLLPGWGGTQRLARLIGESRAKEIIFTAEQYDAETMAEYGFLTDVVDSDTFETAAMDLASSLAEGPPIAQQLTKRAMYAGRQSIEAGLEVEAQAFGQLMHTEDLLEGISAFANDEDPEFTGN